MTDVRNEETDQRVREVDACLRKPDILDQERPRRSCIREVFLISALVDQKGFILSEDEKQSH